jgi:signal transduction histidine kinase
LSEDVLTSAVRLAALAETGLLDALPQASLDRYTRLASLAIGAPVSLVSLVDDRRQFFASATGLPEPVSTARETPLSHSFCQLVVRSGKELIVTDAENDARVKDNLAVRDLGVKAYAGKPIRTRDSQVLGSFCVIDTEPRVWTERELLMLDEICDAVIAEIELRRRANRSEQSERALSEQNTKASDGAAQSKLVVRQSVHDLRSPLGVVVLGASMLKQHAALEQFPEMARSIDRIARNAEHALALVKAMTNEKTTQAIEVVDVTEVCEALAQDLRRGGSSIIHRQESPGLILVSLSETELRRSLENLLSNAQRFAKSQVLITSTKTSREARVTIEDDGPGLPNEEAHETVWERGVRFHVEDGRSGSGLGLSIVKEIFERAGGRVRASRSSLGGAHFLLTLPLA